MSEIPEITESQLKTMLMICGNPDMSVFSQSAPKNSDPLALQCVVGQGEKDTNHLVSLQFLKEITDDHKEQIERTNAESGRTWRVFEITALGRAMFQAYAHPGVN
jgi:hypothetical protein